MKKFNILIMMLILGLVGCSDTKDTQEDTNDTSADVGTQDNQDSGEFLNEDAALDTYPDDSIISGFNGMLLHNENNDNMFDEEDPVFTSKEEFKEEIGLEVITTSIDENNDGFLQNKEKLTTSVTIKNSSSEDFTISSFKVENGSPLFEKKTVEIIETNGFDLDPDYETNTNAGAYLGIQEIIVPKNGEVSMVIENQFLADDDDIDEETNEIKSSRVSEDKWLDTDFNIYNSKGSYYFTSQEDEQNIKVKGGIFE